MVAPAADELPDWLRLGLDKLPHRNDGLPPRVLTFVNRFAGQERICLANCIAYSHRRHSSSRSNWRKQRASLRASGRAAFAKNSSASGERIASNIRSDLAPVNAF